MKKAISLILALVMCLSLCACGEGKNENKNKVVITEDIAESMLEDVLAKADGAILRKMNEFAKARKNAGSSGWETSVTFSKYEVTSTEQVDDYTIRVYGKLYGKNAYSETVRCTFQIDAYGLKDKDASKGYRTEVQYSLGSKPQ